MPRLNIERQRDLEPKRIEYARDKIINLGFDISYEDKTRLEFIYMDAVIIFFPYSGWATGRTINDGRGLNNLLKQLR